MLMKMHRLVWYIVHLFGTFKIWQIQDKREATECEFTFGKITVFYDY